MRVCSLCQTRIVVLTSVFVSVTCERAIVTCERAIGPTINLLLYWIFAMQDPSYYSTV